MVKRLFIISLCLLGIVWMAGCTSEEEQPPEPPPVEETTPMEEAPAPAIEEPVAAVEEFDSSTIHFAYDDYNLQSEAKSMLEIKAQYLMKNTDVRVQVEGHCDERGSNQYNLALGERRANTTKEYLISLGVNPDQLSTISYGEERPLDTASNEESWSKNRRAEFIRIQ